MTTMVNDHHRPLPTNLLHLPAEKSVSSPLDLGEAVAVPEPGRGLSLDALDELSRLISQPPDAPRVGLEAAKLIVKCFETVAADVDRIAKERVAAAEALQQEATTWATVLRESGKVLSGKIEDETGRLFQASKALRQVRAMLAGEFPPKDER